MLTNPHFRSPSAYYVMLFCSIVDQRKRILVAQRFLVHLSDQRPFSDCNSSLCHVKGVRPKVFPGSPISNLRQQLFISLLRSINFPLSHRKTSRNLAVKKITKIRRGDTYHVQNVCYRSAGHFTSIAQIQH